MDLVVLKRDVVLVDGVPLLDAQLLRPRASLRGQQFLQVADGVLGVALDVELESAGDGVAMRTSSGVLLAGVALEDPAGDALPDHRSDDRLVDVDDDGRPGMSLLLDGFKVYTAMRIKMALEGSMESEGLISGHGSMSIEVGTYGDNVPFVNAANKADEAIEQLRVDDQEHLFVFRPVTESQMGCTDVEFSALHELPQDSTEPEPEAPSFPDPNE